MDFATLKTILASYLHRDDLTDTIPTFIMLGQNRMSHDLKTMSMQTTATLSATAGTAEVALPTGTLRLHRVQIPHSGGTKALTQKSLTQNDQVYESAGGGSDTPIWYARYGTTLELSPIPAEDIDIEIIYSAKFTEFVNDTDTDDLLTDYPNIYIYAAMVEAMPFLKDQTKKWDEMYMGEVSRLNDLAYDDEWSGAPLQITNLGVDTP